MTALVTAASGTISMSQSGHCFLLLFLMSAPSLFGQVTTSPVLRPETPTDQDLIFLEFSYPQLCYVEATTHVANGVIRTEIAISGCILVPQGPARMTTTLGPLAAGTYRFELWEKYESFPTALTFARDIVVEATPHPVSALSPLALLVLALALAGVGVGVVARWNT